MAGFGQGYNGVLLAANCMSLPILRRHSLEPGTSRCHLPSCQVVHAAETPVNALSRLLPIVRQQSQRALRRMVAWWRHVAEGCRQPRRQSGTVTRHAQHATSSMPSSDCFGTFADPPNPAHHSVQVASAKSVRGNGALGATVRPPHRPACLRCVLRL